MRALSLTQAWATLVVIGAKKIETRSWMTQFTGRIAIHASAKFPTEDRETAATGPFRAALIGAGYNHPSELPTGAIIGSARLLGCRFTEDVLGQISDREERFGDYSPGRFAWLLADPVRLEVPIPCKGALGLWAVPPDVLRKMQYMFPQEVS